MKYYLSDKTVGGGVGGGASVGALESALPLGVLSLSVEERRGRVKDGLCHSVASKPRRQHDRGKAPNGGRKRA